MKKVKIKIIGSLVAACILGGCGADELAPDQMKRNPVILDLDWNTKSYGLYAEAEARKDFGNISSWNSRVSIQDQSLMVKLLAGKLSGSGGIVTRTTVPRAAEYKLTFDVMFPMDFEWGRGGKVGFGLYVGDGNTGCDKADDGNGGSARLMWYTDNSGNTKFKPYLYYRDMPDDCGDNLVSDAAFPRAGSLEKGKWYRISIYVRSNTGANTNGHVTFAIDDQTILDEDIRWTSNDTKRLINRLSFATFRGGSTENWTVGTDTHIHFDNLKLEKIN